MQQAQVVANEVNRPMIWARVWNREFSYKDTLKQVSFEYMWWVYFPEDAYAVCTANGAPAKGKPKKVRRQEDRSIFYDRNSMVLWGKTISEHKLGFDRLHVGRVVGVLEIPLCSPLQCVPPEFRHQNCDRSLLTNGNVCSACIPGIRNVVRRWSKSNLHRWWPRSEARGTTNLDLLFTSHFLSLGSEGALFYFRTGSSRCIHIAKNWYFDIAHTHTALLPFNVDGDGFTMSWQDSRCKYLSYAS